MIKTLTILFIALAMAFLAMWINADSRSVCISEIAEWDIDVLPHVANCLITHQEE